jgi:hypothetical protein
MNTFPERYDLITVELVSSATDRRLEIPGVAGFIVASGFEPM